MWSIFVALLGSLRSALRGRGDLVLENLALRQQLAVLHHRSKRRQFGRSDRALWVQVSRRWSRWRDALLLVQPARSGASGQDPLDGLVLEGAEGSGVG
jgi:hypothetical protein